MKRIMLGAFAWIAAVTGAHLGLNVNWQFIMNDRLPVEQRKLNVGYIPVT